MSVWFLFHHLYLYIYIDESSARKKKKKKSYKYERNRQITWKGTRRRRNWSGRQQALSRVLKSQKDKFPLCSKFQIELNHFTVHQGDDREGRKEGSLNNFTTMWSGAVQERTTRSLSLFLICCSTYLLSSS